jgi:hypothetical protein
VPTRRRTSAKPRRRCCTRRRRACQRGCTCRQQWIFAGRAPSADLPTLL